MVVMLRLNYQIFIWYSECGCSMNLCDGILINFVFGVPLLTVHNISFLWAWNSFLRNDQQSLHDIILKWLIWSLSLCLHNQVSLFPILVVSFHFFDLNFTCYFFLSHRMSLQHCYAVNFFILFWFSMPFLCFFLIFLSRGLLKYIEQHEL